MSQLQLMLRYTIVVPRKALPFALKMSSNQGFLAKVLKQWICGEDIEYSGYDMKKTRATAGEE